MFTLLHTNDFHNHLTATQADILRRLRQAVGAQGLLVDAGDAVASGNVTFRPWGETILKTMNHIGYDAMTVGNREFHVSRVGFHCKVGLAQFPILCANVRSSGRAGESIENVSGTPAELEASFVEKGKTNAAPPACSHIVRELKAENGATLKVVVFGLTVPMVTERMTARHASAYLFDQPITTALKMVPQWKAAYQPDLMIALTHIGYSQDRKLAEAVPNIDLIIGGHSHTRLPEGERVGKTLIVQTGCFGHNIGRVDVRLNDTPANHTPDRFTLRAALMDLPKVSSEAEIEMQIVRFRDSLKITPMPDTEMTV